MDAVKTARKNRPRQDGEVVEVRGGRVSQRNSEKVVYVLDDSSDDEVEIIEPEKVQPTREGKRASEPVRRPLEREQEKEPQRQFITTDFVNTHMDVPVPASSAHSLEPAVGEQFASAVATSSDILMHSLPTEVFLPPGSAVSPPLSLV